MPTPGSSRRSPSSRSPSSQSASAMSSGGGHGATRGNIAKKQHLDTKNRNVHENFGIYFQNTILSHGLPPGKDKRIEDFVSRFVKDPLEQLGWYRIIKYQANDDEQGEGNAQIYIYYFPSTTARAAVVFTYYVELAQFVEYTFIGPDPYCIGGKTHESLGNRYVFVDPYTHEGKEMVKNAWKALYMALQPNTIWGTMDAIVYRPKSPSAAPMEYTGDFSQSLCQELQSTYGDPGELKSIFGKCAVALTSFGKYCEMLVKLRVCEGLFALLYQFGLTPSCPAVTGTKLHFPILAGSKNVHGMDILLTDEKKLTNLEKNLYPALEDHIRRHIVLPIHENIVAKRQGGWKVDNMDDMFIFGLREICQSPFTTSPEKRKATRLYSALVLVYTGIEVTRPNEDKLKYFIFRLTYLVVWKDPSGHGSRGGASSSKASRQRKTPGASRATSHGGSGGSRSGSRSRDDNNPNPSKKPVIIALQGDFASNHSTDTMRKAQEHFEPRAIKAAYRQSSRKIYFDLHLEAYNRLDYAYMHNAVYRKCYPVADYTGGDRRKTPLAILKQYEEQRGAVLPLLFHCHLINEHPQHTHKLSALSLKIPKFDDTNPTSLSRSDSPAQQPKSTQGSHDGASVGSSQLSQARGDSTLSRRHSTPPQPEDTAGGPRRASSGSPDADTKPPRKKRKDSAASREAPGSTL